MSAALSVFRSFSVMFLALALMLPGGVLVQCFNVAEGHVAIEIVHLTRACGQADGMVRPDGEAHQPMLGHDGCRDLPLAPTTGVRPDRQSHLNQVFGLMPTAHFDQAHALAMMSMHAQGCRPRPIADAQRDGVIAATLLLI